MKAKITPSPAIRHLAYFLSETNCSAMLNRILADEKSRSAVAIKAAAAIPDASLTVQAGVVFPLPTLNDVDNAVTVCGARWNGPSLIKL